MTFADLTAKLTFKILVKFHNYIYLNITYVVKKLPLGVFNERVIPFLPVRGMNFSKYYII